MSERMFFLRGSFLGSSTAAQTRVHNQIRSPHTISIFCPQCNEIWFTGIVIGSKAFCYNRPCDKHIGELSLYEAAGTLSFSWEKEWNSELSEQCLQFELRSWAKAVEDWNTWANNK